MTTQGWIRRGVTALGFVFTTAIFACGQADPSSDAPADPTIDPELEGKLDAESAAARSEFFAPRTFYFIRINGWDANRMTPGSLAEAVEVPGSEVLVYKSNASSGKHCPDDEVAEGDLVYTGTAFSLRTSGNFTNGTPKSSYKIKFTEKSARMFDMRALNLKSMWNDVSQTREALAWELFREARVPASRHTYAKFCINGKYYGLYSVIQQVDKALLKDQFGKNDEGNLYKAYWSDIGPATLEYRQGSDGDDSGSQYYVSSNMDDRSYQLKTNDDSDDDPSYQTYDDLATFIRIINGVGLPGGGTEKFDTAAYRESVESIFDARGFLRWAGLNVLLGSWDNYYRTPANYYLYNSGEKGEPEDFMNQTYFHWVPWDYDNSLGIDFFSVDWQYGDIVDWRATTGGEPIPLVENLLANKDFRAYYLDHLDHLLDTVFTEESVLGEIGDEGTGGHWDRVRMAAFLEANGPTDPPHTGRRFTNDQVYWNGFVHHELDAFGGHTLGIKHYVRMRHDSARDQLTTWWETTGEGASGVSFPDPRTPIPEAE